jgi:hypothetical protein
MGQLSRNCYECREKSLPFSPSEHEMRRRRLVGPTGEISPVVGHQAGGRAEDGLA